MPDPSEPDAGRAAGRSEPAAGALPSSPSQPSAEEGPPAVPAEALGRGRATVVMSVGTGLSRITGFLRLSVMAWAIGGAESKVPDTYNLANAMPNIVYQLVIGEVLATVLVPVFVEHFRRRNREDGWALASTLMNLAVLTAAVLSALAVLLAPWLIKIYTFRVGDPVVRAQQEEVGAFLLRLLMPQMLFYAAGMVLTNLLNAHRRFAAPMFAPVLNNLIATATFVAFRLSHGNRVPTLETLSTADKLLLGGGTTLGVVAMTMVLWPYVLRLPGPHSWRSLRWRHPALRRVMGLAKYSFAYVVANQVGLWVVLLLANQALGGVTAYQASWVLYQLPYGVFAVSVMTALIPDLAEHHLRGDLGAVRRDVSLGLRTTALIILPAAAGFIALGEPIIRLLLEHGVFGARSTELFADTFVMMVTGLGAYAAFQQIMRAFYAMQDTRTPWLVNVAAVAAQIGSAIPLFGAFGVPGLGLSHAISYATGALVGGAILRKRLGGLDGARMAASHLRIGTAAALTGVVAWVVGRAVGDVVDLRTLPGQLAQVGLAVLTGLVTYAAMARVLGVEELRPFVRILTGKLRRSEA